jgi:hypothetical protein
VLQLEPISVEDNFFNIGGHSLLAAQVVSRVRKQLVVELGVRTIFEAPVLADFAQVVAAAPAANGNGEVIDPLDDLATAGLLERLDELSEEELDALLQAMA